jgi:hypothetical protein
MTITIPFLHFISFLVGGGLVLFAGTRFADYTSGRSVYGKILTHDYLVHFFNENWNKYNHLISDNIITCKEEPFGLPYIAKRGRKSHSSKYTINGTGQIPKKSPFNKLIDRKIAQLLAKENDPF